jgi:hypothetical protein
MKKQLQLTTTKGNKFSPRKNVDSIYATVCEGSPANKSNQIAVQLEKSQDAELINITFEDGSVWSGNFEKLKLLLYPPSQDQQNKLLIVIEGGLVQNVMANHPVTVVKIDYDNFGHTGTDDEEEIEEVVGEMCVEPMESNNFADAIRGENLSEHEELVKKWLAENMDHVGAKLSTDQSLALSITNWYEFKPFQGDASNVFAEEDIQAGCVAVLAYSNGMNAYQAGIQKLEDGTYYTQDGDFAETNNIRGTFEECVNFLITNNLIK